ncbi:MAG: Gldg family protein [Deltaproteobacteria bacterium]|nr:Gldg family protein [Deltaproteobacteria bacterium]
MGIQKRYAKYIKLSIYLVIIALVNVAGMTLFYRIDLTENSIYSISEASKKVVSTLSEPLTINVFFTKNLPAPHNNTERYLHDLLEEYAIHANSYFNYKFYDVSPEAEGINPSRRENQNLANNYGIHPVQIQAYEEDEVKFKKAYMGLVLIHGDMVERIPTITSLNGLEYKLTTAIQKMNNKISALLALKDQIKVTLFLSSSLKTVAPLMGLNQISEYPVKLKASIERLNTKSFGKLEYSYIDPSKEPSKEPLWKPYDLMELQWPDLPDDNIPAGKGMIGLVMEYGKKVRKIPLLRVLRLPIIGTRYDLVDVDKLEDIVNDNLESLVDINQDLGYLAGHGTLSISSFSPMGQQNPDAISTFSSLISKTYSLKSINLKDQPIPDSLNCLMIARPTEKFSDDELYQIDQALMKGTNLALFVDAFKEITLNNQQQFGLNRGPTYVPMDTGLEKLLSHYGIHIKQSYVLDENSHKQRLPRNMGGGERPIYFAPIIKNKNINHDLNFLRSIKGLVAVKISPLELDETRISENNLKAFRLFTSSEKSWEIRKNISLNPMFLSPPPSDDEKQSFPLAYIVEGEFPSYFAGKPIPEKKSQDENTDSKDKKESPSEPADEKTHVDMSKITSRDETISKGKPAKIFLMASAEMLKNNVLDPEGNSPNDMLILNTIDTLNHRENIAVMRSKVLSFNPLNDTGSLTKTIVKTFNIAGLPVLLVFMGLIVWLRRHSRKKQIQMMFQK